MLNELKTEMNRTLTENGAVTNRSTGKDCLDLFATIGALRREIETSDETLLFIRNFENGNNSEKIIDDWKKDYHERIS